MQIAATATFNPENTENIRCQEPIRDLVPDTFYASNLRVTVYRPAIAQYSAMSFLVAS